MGSRRGSVNGGYGLEFFVENGKEFLEIRSEGRTRVSFRDFLRFAEINAELKRIVKKHCRKCKKTGDEKIECFLKENFGIYDEKDDI